MQRLFGTFPNRGAGVALVILRVAGAAGLLSPLVSGARLCAGTGVEVLFTLSGIAALLLVIGWFTPLAAAWAILCTLAGFWLCHATTINALMIAILVAVGLLGAGAYSLDAHLYGRRRLVVGRPAGKA
jgi:uncharacterized membrane protein YphA (DoxX/SURF4 family)